MAPPSRQPHFMTVESRIEPAQRRYSSFVLLPVSFLFLVATALRLDLKIRIGGHRDEGILNTSAKGS
ncbi:hypothetical protein VP02_10710 [Pseudomonas ogarae]|uniref:Uncharacterized protein n=1 Tax=Pseudomonas kilonensis TaxID=132476 RepID=A0A0F4XPT4_9PSED|nr:hypothetical protein [Pseudomonas ogarae]KKA07934.1 hypothetical protein VP02_10710 [Pseudomonas ogarae]